MQRLIRAIVAAVLFGGAMTSAADWPQFLGPRRDGTSTETGLLKKWSADRPTVVWRRSVGAGYAGPVVVDGTLVLFHRVDGQEAIDAIDAGNGKDRWRYAYASAYRDAYGKGDGPRATPVVAAGRVYTLGPGGVLTCVKLSDGSKLWQRDLLADYRPRPSFFGVGSTPLVEDGRVLVNVGAAGAGVVAFDAETGKEIWKATDQGASYASPILTNFAGSKRAIFFTRDGVLALDPATGGEQFSHRWRSRFEASVNAATPLVSGNRVFVTASYNTGALLLECDKSSCKTVWQGDNKLSSQFVTPVLKNGFLYGCDGRQDTGSVAFRCLELETGKVRWSKDDFGCASIIVIDNTLLVLTDSGDLVLVEPSAEAYRELARANVLAGTVRAHPALADGLWYGRDDQHLVCLKLKK